MTNDNRQDSSQILLEAWIGNRMEMDKSLFLVSVMKCC